ncbi:MAG TPA: zinc dependent phospholipase C family protein [Cytophagales bacterium]|nr:zinc dependent phospholipase C family protein [Cytophagales bacterium]
MAVFTLPPEMIGFYKMNLNYIEERSVNPDKRRHTSKNEAAYHYLDVDEYGDSALFKLPRYWKKAVEKYGEDTLLSYGVVPWHIFKVKNQLTNAFKKRDLEKILKLSADLGHYVADANVPLHTTKNYNGQLTNQKGIHGLWEARLPELFSENYDFYTGPATYLENPQLEAWKAVENAHKAVDSVLLFEKTLTEDFDQDKKYTFENRNGTTIKAYSKDFSKTYHQLLNGQVEKRMKASIKMVGDFWYTAWVDAGQPDLNSLTSKYTYKKKKETPLINDHASEHD